MVDEAASPSSRAKLKSIGETPFTFPKILGKLAFPSEFHDLAEKNALQAKEKAKLIALVCSKPPKGRARWTLRLLESKVVELGIVERASDSTIGRTLKKTVSSRIAGNAGSSRRRPTAPS